MLINIPVTSKKLIGVFFAGVLLFAVALSYHKFEETSISLLLLLAASIPFLLITAFYTWRGKVHLEEMNPKDDFLQHLYRILGKLWWSLALAAGGSLIAFIYFALQYASGNMPR